MRSRCLPLLLAAAAIARAAPAAQLAIGDVVVTDRGVDPPASASVVRIDPVSGAQSPITSGGLLVSPTGVAVTDDGLVYVIDESGLVVRVDPAAYDAADPGANQTLVSQGGLLTTPQDGSLDADGTLLVAVQVGGLLVRVDPAAFDAQHPEANQTLVAQGDLLSAVKDAAVDRASGAAYVTSYATDRVVRVTPDGGQSLVASGGVLDGPTGLARDRAGRLYLHGYPPNTLVRVDPAGYDGANPYANQAFVSSGGLLGYVRDVAIERSGDAVVVDAFLNHVVRVDPRAYDAAQPDANQSELSPTNGLVEPLAIAVYTPEPDAGWLAGAALAALAARAAMRRRAASAS